MSIVDFKKLFVSTLVLLTVPILGLAQDEDSAAEAEARAEDQAEERVAEEIVVTGSRIKRTTYSSIAPLQIITGQMSREVGLIDPATILQESTSAGGLQIDLTFQGFVLDNGPGSTTIDLRGLGAGRTLVLVDGRRVAPAGVEGAPFAVDLSLIPASLVQQYDILLDGASSIYGSDAVAGVSNIILRKDFDGLEVEGFVSSPDQSGGLQNTISLVYGKNFDRGFLGVGVEFEDNEPVLTSERSWTSDCEKHIEIDENGVIRNNDLFYSTVRGLREEPCRIVRAAGRLILPGFLGSPGSIWHTPGSSNLGVPNFSEDSIRGGFRPCMDADADGVCDVSHLADYSAGAIGGDTRQLFPDFQSLSVMAYGEYTLAGEMNLTPFFEVQYNKRKVFVDSGERAQFFPFVPGDNPFNICNPNGVRGVDCGLAIDSMWNNPNVIAQYVAAFGNTPQDDGLGSLGAVGPIFSRLVWRIKDDRNTTDVEVSQTRFVAGLRGDLPNFSPGPLQDWSFEVAVVAADSSGRSARFGIREDRYDLAVGWTGAFIEDPANPGTYLCGEDADGDGVPDGTDGCVPFDMYASSLYGSGPGDPLGTVATQAEKDWLFDNRDFNTDYDQVIWSAFATGEVFQMPAGPVLAAVGFEYREDEINSQPDEVARDGLFFGFFSDGGAVGEKFTREYYAELEFPLLANVTAAKELDFNISARHTTDQFYGSDVTYSAKLGWRPIDSLLLRATSGTSFRAPNLRENFLLSQTGFNTLFDPCTVPDVAWDIVTQSYIPSAETREPQVLANCVANGVDPTALFLGFQAYSVEISSAGSTDIVEETSDSYTYGFVWDQPFFEAFDLTFGWTYYEIDIENTIIEPNAQFIINDCYNSPTGNSAFCSRITRDAAMTIDFIDSGFINRDQRLVSGYDINVAYNQSVTWFSRPVDLALDLTLNHPKEVSETFLTVDGDVDFDDLAGEFAIAPSGGAYPDWRGQIALRVDVSDYRFTWQTRYISDLAIDQEFADDFDDIFGLSDTCLGPTMGDVLCRDVDFADDYYMHSASIYYYGDVWTIGGGIRNVFNEAPPLVDGDEVFSVRNVPIGVGYDINGRTYFLNIGANFQ